MLNRSLTINAKKRPKIIVKQTTNDDNQVQGSASVENCSKSISGSEETDGEHERVEEAEVETDMISEWNSCLVICGSEVYDDSDFFC